MTGRRTIVGICMLCAIALSAIAAQSAMAVNGTTAFTCKMVTKAAGTAGFSRAHCKKEDAVATEATFEHVSFAEGTTTEITANNETTEGVTGSWTLESTQVGIKLITHAETAHLEGTLSNKKTAGGEHYIHGEGTLKLGNMRVTPEALGCKVKGGQIVTKAMTFTSEGQGHKLKFQPKEGTTFAEYVLEGCSVEEINGTYKITGSFKSLELDGATVKFTEADSTAQGTLKLRGVKMGLEGTLTIKGKDTPLGDTETTPLSPTTVETP